jgi:predicted AAA+ superfamily ATPase
MVGRLLGPTIARAPKSCLLLGPRQTGKSTLLNQLGPDLTLNLSSEAEYFRFSSDPALLEAILRDRRPALVLIDEIQRLPALLNAVQAVLDEPGHPVRPRFLLSGSSARKLKRGQANLLPGRIFSYQLSGLCARELDYKVDVRKALSHGLLPGPFLEPDPQHSEKLLSTYAATYLKEEIQAEALARNVQGFARFLHTAAAMSGTICDFSKIASKSKVSRTGTVRFVEILEDTLVAQRVEIFDEAEDADTIRHPKLYFFDPGVLNGLLGNFRPSPDRLGLLHEHFVYAQLRNSAFALDEPIDIRYFRTRHGLEVDFIVRLRHQVWAIEVKSGHVQRADLEALRAFRSYYPGVHRLVAVGMSETRRDVNGILVCNWDDLLREMDL